MDEQGRGLGCCDWWARDRAGCCNCSAKKRVGCCNWWARNRVGLLRLMSKDKGGAVATDEKGLGQTAATINRQGRGQGCCNWWARKRAVLLTVVLPWLSSLFYALPVGRKCCIYLVCLSGLALPADTIFILQTRTWEAFLELWGCLYTYITNVHILMAVPTRNGVLQDILSTFTGPVTLLPITTPMPVGVQWSPIMWRLSNNSPVLWDCWSPGTQLAF